MVVHLAPDIAIEDWELTERFIRASGPGGQHVNKIETGVQLRFAAMTSPSLTSAVKARLRRLAGRRMTKAGELVIEATSHRSQARNREEARARLADLIARAARAPKRRLRTGAPASQKRKRLEDKRHRGALKASRRDPTV